MFSYAQYAPTSTTDARNARQLFVRAPAEPLLAPMSSSRPLTGGSPTPVNASPSFVVNTARRPEYPSQSIASASQVAESQLIQALLGQDQGSIQRILSTVSQHRPELGLGLNSSSPSGPAAPLPSSLQGMPALSSRPMSSRGDDQTPRSQTSSELPAIQFARAEIHAMPDEDHVVLEISRVGDKSGRCEVQFETRDMNAQAGMQYEATEGTIVFEPGEGDASIHIELLGTDTWEPITDFQVVLKDETAVGAKITRQLGKCRVKLIGTETFPDADLQEALEEDPGLEDDGNRVTFYIAFLRLLWSNPKIRCCTIKRALEDQLHNVHFIVTQYITLFTINFIFSSDASSDDLWLWHDKHHWLIVIVCIQIFSLLVLHVMDYAKLGWGVGGKARTMVQIGLLRRFLYYDFVSRSEIGSSDLALAITRDSVVLVSGYSKALSLVKIVGAVFAIFVFKLTAPLLFHTKLHVSVAGFCPFVFYPVCLGLFMFLRADVTTACLEDVEIKQNEMLVYVQQAVDNVTVINDYKRRQVYADGLRQCCSAWNKAHGNANRMILNNGYFPHWLTAVLVAFWYLWFGGQVIDGPMSLGFFIADLKLLEKFGKEFEQLYQILMAMETTFPDLQRIVSYLNKPTDLVGRLERERYILEKTHDMRHDLAQKGPRALDRVPIILKDPKFTIGVVAFDFTGKLEITQGQMAVFVGKHGHGKTTLLKVMGDSIFPTIDKGEVFVPSHLRMLHVDLQPLFFRQSLYKNLTFGCQTDHDSSTERMQRMLARFGLRRLIPQLDSDEIEWQQALTHKQVYLLHLVRALIANPYVLCVHKPTLAYSDATATLVMDGLKEFVEQRGIEQDCGMAVASRNPRTVLYTSVRKHSCTYADVIVLVSHEGSKGTLQTIQSHQLCDEHLDSL